MRCILLLLLGVVLGAGLYALWQWTVRGQPSSGVLPTTMPATPDNAIRIGLIPEHDVLELRRSYKVLTDYLGRKLGRPVVPVTLSTYEAVLADLREQQIEGAFMGSLVGLLAIDRFGAQCLVKPELLDGVSTYRGLIFVRQDSPIRDLDDLRGRSIALLRATYAGTLFPLAELVKRDLINGQRAVRIVWMGTHDEVMEAVASGRAEVGAVKDLRYQAYVATHADHRFRILASAKPVPNNALVMRGDVADTLGRQIAEILLNMHTDPEGRTALAAISARRFIPCARAEYDPIYEITETIGPAWSLVGTSGPVPRRPGAR